MGPGLDEEYRGIVLIPIVPECHEHCSSCMSAGCPNPEHRPAWTLGYASLTEGEPDAWLCPLCFDWYREPLALSLDPSVPFPRIPLARLLNHGLPRKS